MAADAIAVLAENQADVPSARLVLEGDSGPLSARELSLPIDAVGALVVEVNPRLALDDDYRDFLELAAAQIARAVANVRAYEQERRRAAELAALDRAKTAFFSNVSHEFRTPLTLILGPLEDLLEDPSTGPDIHERLVSVHRNGLRLLKLVNTVLDFSRLESGRMRAVYRPTDLAAHTARLATSFRPATERAGLDLVIETPPAPVPVHVDHELWEKIVFNLLSNAVKFTREGRVEVCVRVVRSEAGEEQAELAVRDTGVGIPAAEQPLLFDRFHRVTGAWSRSHEGTGIGLALVRELAELHGGSVSVHSEPGGGSEFLVRVPFGTAHLPADRISDEPPGVDSRLWVCLLYPARRRQRRPAGARVAAAQPVLGRGHRRGRGVRAGAGPRALVRPGADRRDDARAGRVRPDRRAPRRPAHPGRADRGAVRPRR